MKYLSFEKSVGGVIYREQNEKILYLLLRYRSWQWDFPKGHVEKGETELETLKREIEEETGIVNLEILPKFRKAVNYFYSAKHNEKRERIAENRGIYIFKRAVYFVCKTETEKVQIDFENKAYVWLDFKQAYKKVGNDGSRKILAAANKEIMQNLRKIHE